MIDNFIVGFQELFTLSNLVALIFGALIGYVIGMIPGLTPSIGIALLIPVTFGLEPSTALILLVTLYVAAEYGGGITAILLNAPGTPAAAATAFDGYPMTKNGEAGRALALSITSSSIGAFASAILLIFTAIPMAAFALNFGPFEYFALALFGLSLVTSLSEGSMTKGMLALLLGLLAITVGLDPVDGVPRFTFINDFMGGIPFLPALIGLFALSEVFYMISEKDDNKEGEINVSKVKAYPIKAIIVDIKQNIVTVLKSPIIGYVLGVIPGAGATIASIVSYNEAKRSSKNPETFGKGNPKGVLASEGANNAAVPGSLAPLLSLGIPGSASAAIIIGALTMQGLQPGPMLFTDNPEIPYSLFIALLIAAPILLVAGLLGAKVLIHVVRIPSSILAPFIAGICILGAYAYSNSMYPVWIMLISGVLGYFFRKVGIPTTPIVLAMVLGFMMEVNLRRGLVVANDNILFIFERPIALVLIVLTLVSVLLPYIRNYFFKRGKNGI